MISARLNLTEYSNKVLNMIKVKFDLKDKSEALNKFTNMFGEEIVEKEAKDEYIKELIEIDKKHLRKYGNRKMTLKELDKLCEVS